MKPDLLATCWTSAGDAYPLPGYHTSPLDLEKRVQEASKAGFVGFGFLDFDLHKYLEKKSINELRKVVDDCGIKFREVEFLANWFADGEVRKQSDYDRKFLLEMAAALGARDLKIAPDLNSRTIDMNHYAEELHKLCEEAKTHKTTLALEFLGMSNVPTIKVALELVSKVDHPNLGILIDSWHVNRSKATLEEVASIPLKYLKAVELDDGLNKEIGNPYDDTIFRRLLPGQGEFDLVGLIRTLIKTGWEGPWGIEIIAEDFRLKPIEETLAETVKVTNEVFAKI